MLSIRLFIIFSVAAQLCCICGLAAPNQPMVPRVTLEANEGFCPDGAVVPLVPSPDDPPKLSVWGGYCHVQQKKPVMARTSSFPAPEYLRIYMTGWTSSPTLALERISDHAKFFLVPWDGDLYRWGSYDYRLPRDWQGKQVRLVAAETAEKGLWRAFSEPLVGSGKPPWGDAMAILSLTVLHFLAIMVCSLALTAVAILRGVRDVVHAGVIALAGTALPGYFSFWVGFMSPKVGHYLAVLIIAAAVVGLVFCLKSLDRAGRAVLNSLLTPLLLTGAVTLLVLSTGFLYGGRRDPITLAAARFSHRLPNDNMLPLLLADGIRTKHVAKPMSGDWLSSDRPPLQAGIVLSQFPLFRRPYEERYTAVSVLLQSLWIFGLWLLLTAFHLKSRLVMLVLATCLFSGFVFINSFFVWPKMLAAAYALGYVAAFVAPKPPRNSPLQSWIAPGALLCFSLLSHGGTVFALVPMVLLIPLFTLPWKNKRSWDVKRICAAGLVAFVLYFPWILYQKYYDPPGNRLLKMHLATVDQVDSRSFLETVRTSYGALSFRQILDYKYANLRTAFGGGSANLVGVAALVQALFARDGLSKAAAIAVGLRGEAFFFIAPCLGLFIVAPYALIAGVAKRFRSDEWRTACALWILVFTSILFWCILMFGPAKTIIHTGAYSTILLAFAGSVVSLWALSPFLAWLVSLLQIALNFLLYGLLLRVPYPDGPLPEGVTHLDTLLLCSVSFAAVLALLWNIGRSESAPVAEVRSRGTAVAPSCTGA